MKIEKRPVERWGAFFGGVVDDDADTPQSDVIVWVVITLASQVEMLVTPIPPCSGGDYYVRIAYPK